MDANNELYCRRLTLADFEGMDLGLILKSRGETVASMQQLELDYSIAEKGADEHAKKRLNARLQPVYQKLISQHRGVFRA